MRFAEGGGIAPGLAKIFQSLQFDEARGRRPEMNTIEERRKGSMPAKGSGAITASASRLKKKGMEKRDGRRRARHGDVALIRPPVQRSKLCRN